MVDGRERNRREITLAGRGRSGHEYFFACLIVTLVSVVMVVIRIFSFISFGEHR